MGSSAPRVCIVLQVTYLLLHFLQEYISLLIAFNISCSWNKSLRCFYISNSASSAARFFTSSDANSFSSIQTNQLAWIDSERRVRRSLGLAKLKLVTNVRNLFWRTTLSFPNAATKYSAMFSPTSAALTIAPAECFTYFVWNSG